MVKLLENETSIKTNIEPLNKRYSAVLTATEYTSKPNNYKRIHDELNSADSIELTLYELLEEINKGRTWRNGIYDYPELMDQEKTFIEKWKQEQGATNEEVQTRIKHYHISKEHKRNDLKYTTLAVLDVDDVLGKSEPLEVMEETGAIALYYTFSHQRMSKINTNENRYRLLYDLSEPVTNKGQLQHIQNDIRSTILQKYPYLNEQNIGGKSHGIENLTTQFHGTNKGYKINKNYITVDVAELIEEHEKEQNFIRSMIQLEQMTNSNKKMTSADEILDIAQFLGDLNDILAFDEWATLAIGLWNTAQLQGIDDKPIIEALKILDGNRNNERYYLDYKKPLIDTTSRATIKTLYKVASDNGYKFKKQEQPPLQDVTELDHVKPPIKINQYIEKEQYLKLLLNDDKRILINAETGTGKTRSAVEASREMLKQDKKSFVYIALPVIALSEQTERLYGTNTAIIGTNKVNTYKEVKKAISNGTRLLVGTYDKAQEVYNHLNGYNITIIADEAHKEVVDYDYRRTAINNLFNLADSDKVHKFIGMTGTPSELDLSTYDSVTTFELKKPKVIADKLQFIEYLSAKELENITARAIEQEIKQGKKVLAIVDNKKAIKRIATALRQQKINVSTITADNRKSKTYRHILDKETFDKNTDVVLSTRVLADGINIQNTKDYVLMIAPNQYKGADFYNIDLIRQASNRFRNPYEKIILLLYVNKAIYGNSDHERASEQPYNLEHRYKFLLRSANIVKAESESQFKKNIAYFTPDIAEKTAGLFRPKEAKDFNFKRAYENKRLAEQGLNYDLNFLQALEALERRIFTIDKRHIRNQASKDKEQYYSLHPYAFKKAISESINVLEIETIQAHDYFLQKTSDLTSIIERIQALETENNKEKRNDLNIVLDELIYRALRTEYFLTGAINESLEEWKLLSEKMNSHQYNALKNVIKFLDHDEAIRELEYVEKVAQTNELSKHFEAINTLTTFKGFQGNQTQVTEQIYSILEKHITDKVFYSAKERDSYIDVLAKGYKIKRYKIAERPKLFKNVFKKFFVLDSMKNVRIDGKVKRELKYKVIDFDYMAKQRNLEESDILEMYRAYEYSK